MSGATDGAGGAVEDQGGGEAELVFRVDQMMMLAEFLPSESTALSKQSQ